MNEQSRKKKPNIGRWLPGVIISLIALFVVFRLAQWEELGPAIARIPLQFILFAVLLTILFLLVRAIAWRVILGNHATIAQTFWAINQGYLLNNLFPFRAGEFGRALLLGQAANLAPARVLSSIVIERAFDLAIAAGLLLATLPLALGMAWARSVALITLGVVTGGLVLLFVMSRNQQWVIGFVEKIGARWGWVRRIVIPQLNALMQGLATLSDPRQFLLSLGWIGISWVVAVSTYYVFLLPINPQAPFWWGMFTDAVLAMGIAIPSAPAALGTFEASIVGALTILGINQTAALAYAITLHFLQFVITGIFGLVALARQGKSVGAFLKDIQSRLVNSTTS
ncbi:MAG: lysylphosphatidylglycerol synthase transmembrane domain-containing protein [Chloroflexota bacterium]